MFRLINVSNLFSVLDSTLCDIKYFKCSHILPFAAMDPNS
jgi:hypothetical protein